MLFSIFWNSENLVKLINNISKVFLIVLFFALYTVFKIKINNTNKLRLNIMKVKYFEIL